METLVYFLCGLLAGGVAGWILCRALTRLKSLEKIREVESRMNQEQQRRINAESRLEEKAKAWEEASKTMRETFDASASAALRNNNQSFLELAKQTMENYINQSKGDLDKRKEAIEQMLRPFKESLDKHEKMTHSLRESTRETFGGLKNYMDELQKSNAALTKETHTLVTALKAPKVRGRWGEIGLKRIVEFSGMSSYCDFTEQVSVATDDGRLRPDMVVRLPGGRSVVVDSKAPLSAYLESLEQEDEELKKKMLLKHADATREHMKELGSKAYWSQFDNTVDFVVLYMEIESAFGAALLQYVDLIQDGISNRVVFATPTTLIALLRTVAYSWKQEAITENAQRIGETGKELFDRLCVFAGHLAEVGRGLNKSVASYNDAIGSWVNRLLPSGKKLEEMGATTGKKQIPEIEKIEVVAREGGTGK